MLWRELFETPSAVNKAARMPTLGAEELYVDRLEKMKAADNSFQLILSEFPLDVVEPYRR